MKTRLLWVWLLAVATQAAKVETWPEQKKIGAPGLAARQSDDKLPHPADRAAAEAAAKILTKTITAKPARLDARADGGWTLAAGWRMAVAGREAAVPEISAAAWLPAVVPGTALGTLVANGVYPDPYFGLNNLFIPETLCRQDYWFRLEFPSPDLGGRDAAGQRVLPTDASENYVSLLPGETRTLTIETPGLPAGAQFTAEGWNSAPLKIAVEAQ